jgi:hypothetical protein
MHQAVTDGVFDRALSVTVATCYGHCMVTYLRGCTCCGTVNVVTEQRGKSPSAVAIQHEWESLTRFAAQRCTVDPDRRSESSAITTAYRNWCQAEGVKPLPNQVIGKALSELLSVEKIRSNGKRYYRGIALKI